VARAARLPLQPLDEALHQQLPVEAARLLHS
jgi:hypothetical protein